MPSILNATTTSGLVTSADNSGSLQLQTNNGTTAVTIDTSQNVGIGTSSPTGKLDVAGGVYLTAGASNIIRAARPNASGDTFTIRHGSGADNQIVMASANDSANNSLSLQTWNGSSYNSIYVNGSNTITASTAGSERMRITSDGLLQFNSGYGSVATAYGCRAWVNFNGTGTVAIRASGNVSSITDNGTGDYTVNFTNAMPDADYSVSGATRFNTSNSRNNIFFGVYNSSAAFSTGSVRVNACNDGGTLFDCDVVTVEVVR